MSVIIDYMKDLKCSTSCGLDGITARLLKAAGPSIYPVLLHICNISIQMRTFPTSWKIGCITPLHKSGDTINPDNFRPISVLPCLGKMLERLVHNQVYGYLTSHNLLSPRQSGFRKGYSTGTCLIDFLHDIYSNIDEGHASGVLFLDLKKAFDVVDHQILLEKLKYLGFRESAVNWFGSYLKDRQQVTKLGGKLSNKNTVTHGVPQGSILGPLLFSLYVNDLPNVTTSG